MLIPTGKKIMLIMAIKPSSMLPSDSIPLAVLPLNTISTKGVDTNTAKTVSKKREHPFS
tara:strand:- start:1621 stop:1797 length:177 start_codon:yes stop_codon:yes gene_type:complete